MTRWLGLLAWVTLLAATLGAYAPAMRGELQFDDSSLVDRQDLISLDAYAAPARWLVARGRPLTDLTFALNHAVSGWAPLPLHLVNFALHLVATWLVYLLARGTMRRLRAEPSGIAAFVTAALFALHPIQSQAVAYLSQRAEELAAVLLLAGLLLLIRSDEDVERRARVARRLGALLVFVLGLAAKQTAAVLPAAWLLHAAWFPPPGEEGATPLRRIARRLPVAAPFVLVAALAALASLFASRGRLDAGLDIPWLGPGRYALSQLRVLPLYLRLLVWPGGQNPDWDLDPSGGLLTPPSTLAGAVFLGGLFAAALLLERRTRAGSSAAAKAGRLAGFGFIWFVLLLTPSSSIVPLADLVMEHRVYLPALGLFLPAGAGAVLWIDRAGRAARVGGVAVIASSLLALGAATRARAVLWATPLALWTDAVSKSPDKPRPHVALAHALRGAGDPRRAIREYERALAAGGQSASLRDVVVDLANTHLDLGEIAEAATLLQRAVEAGADRPDVLHNLAVAWMRMGRLSEAEPLLTRLVAEHPDSARPRNALGLLHERRGDLGAARDAFATAALLDPNDAVVLRNLARAEERLGRVPEACEALARAQRASGRSLEGYARLGCAGR